MVDFVEGVALFHLLVVGSFLLELLVLVLLGEIHWDWDAIDLAVVVVQLVEFDRVGAVSIDEGKYGVGVLLGDRAVESFEDFGELVDGEHSAPIDVVGQEDLVEGEVLVGEGFVELAEAVPCFELELLGDPAFFTVLLEGLAFREGLSSIEHGSVVLEPWSQGDVVFLHLPLQFFQGNGAVVVFVQFLEDVDFFFTRNLRVHSS